MMNKKIRMLHRFLLMCGSLTIGSQSLVAQAGNLFEGFNLDDFLKEMEKAYDDDLDKRAFNTPTKAPAPTGTERTITTQAPAKKPQTKEELFLTPITQTIQEKGKPAKVKLTAESLNAFKEIMHELVTLLHAVETKVDGSTIFSLPFKEQFAQFHDSIDKIVISYGTLLGKKLYATVLPYTQPADLKAPATQPSYFGQSAKGPQQKEGTNIRQNIIDALKELRELDKELSNAIKTEEKSMNEEVSELKELATKEREEVSFDQTPLAKTSKRKRHETKSAPSKPTKAVKKVKKLKENS